MSLGCGVQASLGMRYVCQPWFKVFGRSFVVSCDAFLVCNLWRSLLHIQLNIKEWYMYMYIILINLVQVPYCNLQTKFFPFRFIALMHQKSKPPPPCLLFVLLVGFVTRADSSQIYPVLLPFSINNHHVVTREDTTFHNVLQISYECIESEPNYCTTCSYYHTYYKS